MNNFELIDDYLTNRLSEQDRKSFEKQLETDSALQADVEFQRDILQGLKAARMAELKAILNKVPVASPITIFFSPLRIAAGLIGAAALATGLYYYSDKNQDFDPNQISSSLMDSIRHSEQNTAQSPSDSSENELNQDVIIIDKQEKTETKNDPQKINENQKGSKPNIDLLDPTSDLNEVNANKVIENTPEKRAAITLANIEVDINSTERKYKSHYQFVKGKLVLYGSFDSGLYEILEVNGETTRSLFLYYKTIYYFLDDSQTGITQLKEISDPILVKKLNTFRSN